MQIFTFVEFRRRTPVQMEIRRRSFCDDPAHLSDSHPFSLSCPFARDGRTLGTEALSTVCRNRLSSVDPSEGMNSSRDSVRSSQNRTTQREEINSFALFRRQTDFRVDQTEERAGRSESSRFRKVLSICYKNYISPAFGDRRSASRGGNRYILYIQSYINREREKEETEENTRANQLLARPLVDCNRIGSVQT